MAKVIFLVNIYVDSKRVFGIRENQYPHYRIYLTSNYSCLFYSAEFYTTHHDVSKNNPTHYEYFIQVFIKHGSNCHPISR
jgi:hypothetical protein